jgi:imidazoleglycerol phosphate dehydratase HisB
MLEQISKHGNFDLFVKVDGDLEVDEHHTIEDTAIVLGDCFLQALGSKKGIERYALSCQWMIVWHKLRLISVEDLGWFGMQNLSVKKLENCLRKCFITSSNRFLIVQNVT